MAEVEDAAEERIDPITFFSPEIHEPVTGMIYLGKYSKEIKFVGHTYVMETIRPHLKYAIGVAMEPYRNTLVEPAVWGAMHVGVALTSIDRNRAFCPPVGNDEIEFVKARLNYITSETGWYQPTIDYLFGEYLGMEAVVIQAITELHSLAVAGKVISSPSPGSSTAPEPLTDETPSEDHPWAPSSLKY